VKALIFVTPKRDVLDPQGKAIQKACASLGFAAVADVRQGKLFEVTLDGVRDRAAADALAREIAAKLLANPNIEDFRVERITD
jgi:phosphoribosylformylglycinamidine synthase